MSDAPNVIVIAKALHLWDEVIYSIKDEVHKAYYYGTR